MSENELFEERRVFILGGSGSLRKSFIRPGTLLRELFLSFSVSLWT
jgi:hypothetical protein